MCTCDESEFPELNSFFSFFEIVTLLIKPFLVGKSNNFAYPCSMVDITSIFNKVLFLSFMSWIIQFATASLIFIPYLKIITHTIGFQIAKYFTMVYCLVDVYSDHVIRKTFSSALNSNWRHSPQEKQLLPVKAYFFTLRQKSLNVWGSLFIYWCFGILFPTKEETFTPSNCASPFTLYDKNMWTSPHPHFKDL